MYIWLASPKPSKLFCPYRHPFLSSFALFVSFRLLLVSNHSANVSCPTFPRPYTTTYLSRMLRLNRNRNPIPWVLQIRKLPRASSCTHGLVTVSFHSFSLSVYFDAVSVPPPGFPSVTICQPTYRDCSLHVPRRLWKVADSNRLLILSVRGITECATVCENIPLIPCRFASCYSGFSFLYLNSFMSSYIPFAIFIAISC